MVFGIGRKSDVSETFQYVEDAGSVAGDSVLEFQRPSKGTERSSPYEKDDGEVPTRRSRVLRVKEGEENRKRSKSAGRKIADGARSVVGLLGTSMTMKNSENTPKPPIDSPESESGDDDEEALVKWVEETKSPKKKTFVPKLFRSSKSDSDDDFIVDTHIQFTPEDLVAGDSCMRKVSLSTTASDRSSQDGLQESAGSLNMDSSEPTSPSKTSRRKMSSSSASSRKSSQSLSPRKKSSNRVLADDKHRRSSRESRSVARDADKATRRASADDGRSKSSGKELEKSFTLMQIIESDDADDNTHSRSKSPRRNSHQKRRSSADKCGPEELSPTGVQEHLSESTSQLHEKHKSSKSGLPPKSPRKKVSDKSASKLSATDREDDDEVVEVFSAPNSPRRRSASNDKDDTESITKSANRSKSSKSDTKSPTKASRGSKTERGSRSVCPISPGDDKKRRSLSMLEEDSGKKSSKSSSTVSGESHRRSRDSKSVATAPPSRTPKSPTLDDNAKGSSRSSPRKSRDSKSVATETPTTVPKAPVVMESPTKTQQSRNSSPSKGTPRGRSSRDEDRSPSPSRHKRSTGSDGQEKSAASEGRGRGLLSSPKATSRRRSRSRHERTSPRSPKQDDNNRRDGSQSERSHHQRSPSKVSEKSRRSERTVGEKSRRSERTVGEKSRHPERTTTEKSRRSERTTVKPILRDSSLRDDSSALSSPTKDRGFLSPADCDKSFSRVMQMLDEMTPGTPLDVSGDSPSKKRSSQESERLLVNIEKSPTKSSKTRRGAVELLRREVEQESRSRSKSRSRRSGSRSPSRHRHRSRSRGATTTRRTKREED